MTDVPDRYAHPKRSLEEVLAAIEKGITASGTARVLGVHRHTVLAYRKRWKSVDEALEGQRKELVDLAEMALRGAVLRQEPWAVTFALRTLGKDEGYTERQEHTGANGTPLIPVNEIILRLPAEEGGGE